MKPPAGRSLGAPTPATRRVVLATDRLDVGYLGRRGDRTTVLADVSARLHAGEFASLVGVNGSGKSTLLRTLVGGQRPLRGHVQLDGEDLRDLDRSARARRVALVSTERVAVGQLRAYDLVALGRYPYTGWSGRLQAHDHRVVQDALERTGAWHLAAREVTGLSDGERQRVLVARALAQEPALLVLDEPTAFLDVRARMELVVLMRELASGGVAVLLSTHDLELVLQHVDTVWLASTTGRLHCGAPEDLGIDGTLADAFGGDGRYGFDPRELRFSLHREPVGQVVLEGEPDSCAWAERALRRADIGVSYDGDASVRVVCVDGPPPRWQVHAAGRRQVHERPSRLVDQVRRLLTTSDVPDAHAEGA